MCSVAVQSDPKSIVSSPHVIEALTSSDEYNNTPMSSLSSATGVGNTHRSFPGVSLPHPDAHNGYSSSLSASFDLTGAQPDARQIVLCGPANSGSNSNVASSMGLHAPSGVKSDNASASPVIITVTGYSAFQGSNY